MRSGGVVSKINEQSLSRYATAHLYTREPKKRGPKREISSVLLTFIKLYLKVIDKLRKEWYKLSARQIDFFVL